MEEKASLDIFAADLDVKDFVPIPKQISTGDNIPVATSRNKWKKTFANIPVQNKPKLTNTSQKKEDESKSNVKPTPVPQKAPIKEITPLTQNLPKKEPVKFDLTRPNLTVLQGKGVVKTNIHNITITPENKIDVISHTDMDKKDSSKNDAVLPKPQTSGVQGRMTASSFMNLDQPTNTTNVNLTPNRTFSRPKVQMQFTPSYPKGIPKSFLTAEHQQQIATQARAPAPSQFSNQQAAPSINPEPVWEALPSKKPEPQSQPNWTGVKPRFDQLPTSQYVNQVHPQYSDGQGFGPTDQGLGQSSRFPGPTGQSSRPISHGYSQEEVQRVYNEPMYVETDKKYRDEVVQQYSPSDTYADMTISEAHDEYSDHSLDSQQSSSKRLSAFQRLGPVTQPKKPKLTINLMVGKEQAVREVVQDSKDPDLEKYTPVLDRPDIQTSLDDTVMKYLMQWPWKKPWSTWRTLTARESKSVMQLELDQMEPEYEKDKCFFGVVVSGYPSSWNKEDVLDAVLEAVKGKSMIPCFIEFTKEACKFLVIRSRTALVAIHKMGFKYRKDDVMLNLAILNINISVNQIDFIPRLILRRRLSMAMEGTNELTLKNFTLASDVSHFLYFPLNRHANQTELMQLQTSVPWENLTKLDLSHNRITSLSGFDLPNHTPKLKHLDLSHNQIDSIKALLAIRDLPLSSVILEGNPVCLDYIEQERYIKALKMIFPALREIDGVRIPRAGEMPQFIRNYAPLGSEKIAAKVLETMFPLLDSECEDRQLIEDMYMDDAVMTITFMYKLRYNPIYKDYHALFSRARVLDEGEMDQIQGVAEIAKMMYRWPKLEHDPLTFTVDVMYHTESTTIVRISGVMKVTAETLAEEEHMLYFTRTLVLHTLDSREYKIANEMIYWDLPVEEVARQAFRMTTGRSRSLSLKVEGTPSPELRKKLVEIFMNLTELDPKRSEKCLESKEWHLKNALEHFAKLLKSDNLEALYN